MATRRELLAGLAAVSLFPLRKGESKTMDQRVSIVTLGVKDLETSKKFYVDGFGWKPVFENKEIIFFQTGGMVFALFLRDQLAADFQMDAATFGHAAMALGYNVRAKSEVNGCSGGGNDSKAGARGVLGRLLRIFRRPRRVCMGGGLESGVAIGG